jgi:hypothetical protein
MDIDTASPPVSPSVVAAILMTQKTIVISGTLLEVFCVASLMLCSGKYNEKRGPAKALTLAGLNFRA